MQVLPGVAVNQYNKAHCVLVSLLVTPNSGHSTDQMMDSWKS